MNWLDIIILVVIAVSTLIGLRTGIIKAVLSLAGLIVGIILAGQYYVPLAEQLSFIPYFGAAKIIAFILILVGVMVGANVAASLLKKVTSVMMLGWVNHLGGAVFGLVMGSILCGALLATWLKFIGVGEAITESSMASILLKSLPIALALLPSEFDTVRSFFQ